MWSGESTRRELLTVIPNYINSKCLGILLVSDSWKMTVPLLTAQAPGAGQQTWLWVLMSAPQIKPRLSPSGCTTQIIPLASLNLSLLFRRIDFSTFVLTNKMCVKYISSSITGTNKNPILISIQTHLYKTLINKDIIPNKAFFVFQGWKKWVGKKMYLLPGIGGDFRLSCLCTLYCLHCFHCLDPLPTPLHLANYKSLCNTSMSHALHKEAFPDLSEEVYIYLLCVSSSTSPSIYLEKQIYFMETIFPSCI